MIPNMEYSKNWMLVRWGKVINSLSSSWNSVVNNVNFLMSASWKKLCSYNTHSTFKLRFTFCSWAWKEQNCPWCWERKLKILVAEYRKDNIKEKLHQQRPAKLPCQILQTFLLRTTLSATILLLNAEYQNRKLQSQAFGDSRCSERATDSRILAHYFCIGRVLVLWFSDYTRQTDYRYYLSEF